MRIYLDKYQETLLINGWTFKVNRGLFKLHFYWEKEIKNKTYLYYERDICPEYICKRHRIMVLKVKGEKDD
jgi:hypothetical protein